MEKAMFEEKRSSSQRNGGRQIGEGGEEKREAAHRGTEK